MKKLTVRDLIKNLMDFNLDAEVGVIANCQQYDFSLTWDGGGDGEMDSKRNCKGVHFYVDELCGRDKTESE